MRSLNKFLFLFLISTACIINANAQTESDFIFPSAEPEFKVYPNPNRGESETYVSLQGFQAQDLLVVVYDMFGREIYSKVEVMENEGFLFTVASDGNKLSQGVYLITASADDKIFRQKLIVK